MLDKFPTYDSAEYSLVQSYYIRRAPVRPSITSIAEDGTVGWTNSGSTGIVNPGRKLIGTPQDRSCNRPSKRQRQPCPRGRKNAQRRNKAVIPADAAQRRLRGQTRLTRCQSARAKADLRGRQIEALGAPWSRPSC